MVAPKNTVTIPSTDGGDGWSLRLIPSTFRPTTTDVYHTYNHGIHPTVCEYLSLQALRLQSHQIMIDQGSYCWLEGEYYDQNNKDLISPMGRYNPATQRVNINVAPPYTRSDLLGVRPPVWDKL